MVTEMITVKMDDKFLEDIDSVVVGMYQGGKNQVFENSNIVYDLLK